MWTEVPETLAVLGRQRDRRHRGLTDVLLMLLWAAVEPFGFRQLTVYWRLRGLVRQLRGNAQEWGVMTRRGFDAPAVTTSPGTAAP